MLREAEEAQTWPLGFPGHRFFFLQTLSVALIASRWLRGQRMSGPCCRLSGSSELPWDQAGRTQVSHLLSNLAPTSSQKNERLFSHKNTIIVIKHVFVVEKKKSPGLGMCVCVCKTGWGRCLSSLPSPLPGLSARCDLLLPYNMTRAMNGQWHLILSSSDLEIFPRRLCIPWVKSSFPPLPSQTMCISEEI